jgi:hypothetical protein
MQDRSGGAAVQAMGRHGLGCLKHARSLVPSCFHHQPTWRLISPRTRPAPLTDDARGRAWDTRDAEGVTARSRRIAAHAAARGGLAPRLAPLERTSVPGDGRDHWAAAPAEQVVPITRGERREPRPDGNHGMWALRVEHHAGLPRLRPPLRGQRRAATDVGAVVRRPVTRFHTPDGLPARVAARALANDAQLARLAQTPRPWSTPVPATGSAAHAALAPADPQTMAARPAGARAPEWTAVDGSVEPRWWRILAAPRQTHAQRRVDTPLRTPSDPEGNAVRTRWHTTCAGAAAARPARLPLAPT